MKKLLFGVLALASTMAVSAQKKMSDVAKFNSETFDFGKVKQSVPPTATIIITNISKEPLIIEQASPSCGCTASDYTKSPIAPGKTGYIKATYNAVNLGAIHKTITVKFSGVDETKAVNLTGEVLEPAAYDKWMAENKVKSPNAQTSTLVTTNADGTTTTKKIKHKRNKRVEKTTTEKS
ncbi:MAG: DUF1573 domain-containing protein [Chitinophagaceae bacterium]|nr:DUF1573 domain-containing protein [Chitinophagaceae bacterium]